MQVLLPNPFIYLGGLKVSAIRRVLKRCSKGSSGIATKHNDKIKEAAFSQMDGIDEERGVPASPLVSVIPNLPLEKRPNLLSTVVDLTLDLMLGAKFANLLKVEFILTKCVLLESINVDFAESHLL